VELFALPLDGYYRSRRSPYDTLAFLKLYPDGYWLYTELPWVDLPWVEWQKYDYAGPRDGLPECWAFNFLDFIRSLDVPGIKARYPNGHCPRDGSGPYYQSGLYQRDGNRLHLTSCGEDGPATVWGNLDVTAPGRLYSNDTLADFEFVPEGGPEPAG
jgi:hypothetical protein